MVAAAIHHLAAGRVACVNKVGEMYTVSTCARALAQALHEDTLDGLWPLDTREASARARARPQTHSDHMWKMFCGRRGP